MHVSGIPELWNAIWLLAKGALSLNANAFRQLYESPHEAQLAVGVLALAAVSQAIGQSVVLFLHRVPPRRFLLSLLLTALFLAGAVLVWTGVFWIAVRLLFGVEHPFQELFIGVSLGHAPMLFGFLILIPWLGLIIRGLLQIWTLLAVTLSLHVFELPFHQILPAAFIGWLAVELLYRLAGKPVQWTSSAIQLLFRCKREAVSIDALRETLLRSMRRL